MNNVLGLNSDPKKQVYFPILGRTASQDPKASTRAVTIVISTGTPWAYKMFIRRAFLWFSSLDETRMLENLWVMFMAIALVQKKNAMKVC